MSLIQQFDNDGTLNLGALASLDAVLVNTKIDGSRGAGFRVVQSNFWFAMNNKTTDEGPIMIGISASMVAGEIEAAIEADPQDPTSDDARGKGTFIKPLFMIGKDELKIPIATDGDERSWKPHKISYGKNGWSIREEKALSVWGYNMDGAALTTGIVIEFFAEHFGVWLRD